MIRLPDRAVLGLTALFSRHGGTLSYDKINLIVKVRKNYENNITYHGSRFGTGIKQLEPVDDANHIIMDYSIHDAIEAGFNHVVFIIRKDIEKEFKEVIGDRIASICSTHNVTVDYAFQDINDIPGELPAGRTKPWGTGQAVLAAKSVIDTPFIVINADDYYGKEGFKAVHDYLVNGGKSCMAGFVLKNTLSDNGGVTRGICKMDENGNLTEVVETKNIVKTADGAKADGMVVDVNSLVSMNMWGLTPDFLDVLENGFKEFFEKEVPSNPQKAEYLIPIFIGELLEQGKMSVKVLKTNDTWYGMTYHEDVVAVKDSFKKMLEKGVYKADLFADLWYIGSGRQRSMIGEDVKKHRRKELVEVEAMEGKYLELVQKCINYARSFMSLPEPIESYFEDCPSDRFKTMDNAAEVCGNKLYFNKPWFTGQDRWENHRVDIEFFIFHELRHLHQHYEIALLDSNNIVHEDISTIVSWKNGFINYIRNEGGSTQAVNLSQEVEIDANAYALCLSNMLHISDNIELRFSVPQEAMDLADPRSRQYYENRPELKRYIDKLKRDAGQPVVRKPERNELCPCGSGKKFKKCCIGKGIYD